MKLFLFTADTHLAPLIWLGRPTLTGDAYHAFEQVVTLAIANHVPLLMGGDTFDKKRPDSESVGFAYQQMDRMQQAGLPVYYIQGQHCLADPPWLSVHEWPQHAHKRLITLPGGELLYGLDWCSAGVLQQELALIPPGTTYLLCHQVWQEHMGLIGVSEGSFKEIPHVRTVLTGDYHVAQSTQHVGASGQGLEVWSPGSTHLRAIDQAPEKYCLLGEAHPGGRLVMTPQLLKTRPVYKTSVTGEPEFAELCRSIQTYLEALVVTNPLEVPILVVTYPEGIAEAGARLSLAIGTRAHLFEKPRAATATVFSDEPPEAQAMIFSIPEALPQLTDDALLQQAAIRLWNSPDVAAELVAIFNEFV